MVVRDVRQGVAIYLFDGFEFFHCRAHIRESLAMRLDVLLELSQVAPVELHQRPARHAFDYQREVSRRHRQEWQEGEPRAEVDGRKPRVGPVARIVAFQHVGLRLARVPFVLAREFVCPDFVEEFYEIAHEAALGAVFRRAEFCGVDFLALEMPLEDVEMVIDLEVPDAPVDPFAQFTAASDCAVNEGGVYVDHGFLVAELQPRGPADEFLPQCPGPSGRRIYLQLELALEADPIDYVSERQRTSRRRDENFHRVFFARLQSARRFIARVDFQDIDAIDLPGESASDELVDLEAHLSGSAVANAGNFAG